MMTRGATPLIRAAANGDLEIVKLLLAHGADATMAMADRQTPIHAAIAGRIARMRCSSRFDGRVARRRLLPDSGTAHIFTVFRKPVKG